MKRLIILSLVVLICSFFVVNVSAFEFEDAAWVWAWWTIEDNAGNTSTPEDDCIRLNTDIPFVGRCIKKDTDPATVETNYGNVFPKLVGGLMRVVMAAVVIIGFLAILVGWFMMTAGWVKQDLVNKWRDLIIKVIGWLVLVWLLGIILNLINPNFFKTDITHVFIGNEAKKFNCIGFGYQRCHVKPSD